MKKFSRFVGNVSSSIENQLLLIYLRRRKVEKGSYSQLCNEVRGIGTRQINDHGIEFTNRMKA